MISLKIRNLSWVKTYSLKYTILDVLSPKVHFELVSSFFIQSICTRMQTVLAKQYWKDSIRHMGEVGEVQILISPKEKSYRKKKNFVSIDKQKCRSQKSVRVGTFSWYLF